MVASKETVKLDAAAEKIHVLVKQAETVEGHIVDFCDALAAQIKAGLWTKLLNAETGKPRYRSARASRSTR